MDRRELLKRIVSSVAATAAVPIAVSAYDGQSVRPALAVIETTHSLNVNVAERIVEMWKHAVDDTPFEGVKVVVLSEGMKLTMLGPDGTPITRVIETSDAV